MQRVLVTGGAGFIGSHLWRRGWALGVKDRDRHEISREK